ncbi:MAG TPA: phosphate acyltransferase [Aestuariivirgaceae bacterium]|nr:phosphate acyltransferase [Aestuariivirgaceae bacterium]
MGVIDRAKGAILGKRKRVIFPEGGDARIVEAARRLAADGFAEPILFEDALPVPTSSLIETVLAARPGMTEGMAVRLLARPLPLAGAMVAAGEADAIVAGAAHPTSRIIEAGLMTIGLRSGIATPSSFFLMTLAERELIFADCAVNVAPTASELADIAVASAFTAGALLHEPPRVAFLSFSTHGSSAAEPARRIRDAVEEARRRAPEIAFDGELQGDAALDPAVAARKIKGESTVAGRANVLVFPSLEAGNIAYKLVQQLAGARAIGPILQGFRRPISDLSRGATVDDIVDTTVLLLAMS